MKTTGQKLVSLFLATFMAMSIMAVSLSGTAYAWVEKKAAADKCPPADNPTYTVDLSPQAKGCAEESELTETCANDPKKKAVKGLEEAMCGVADAAAKAAESKIAQESFQKMTSMLIAFESMINKLLWPVLMMTGDLMGNDILFGPGMEQKLYDIWVPVRNIVNIFFVVALIGLALYSVLGINSENGQYSIKAMLPKLIAGIIAVNFSFIAIKVVLDTVNVFTTAIFAIPTQVQGLGEAVLNNEDTGDNKRLRDAFCEQLYLDGKKFKDKTEFEKGVENSALFMIRGRFGMGGLSDANAIKALGEALKPPEKKAAFDAELKKLQEEFSMCAVSTGGQLELTGLGLKFFEKYGAHNAALAMAINMGEIMFYNRVSTSLIGSGTYESLAIKTIFILLMYLIYGASFIAMFVVLLARLIVVWMGLAMSPVIALSVAIPMVKDKLGLGELTSKFMKHAIAPVMIAFPMMIGWVMLNALHSTATDTTTKFGAKDMLIPGIPIPGLETLQGLLVSLATAAVVWIGVFAAAEGTIAGKVTGFLKDRLESFGKFIATAPIKYTPWVPVQLQEGGKTESYSPMALLNAANKLQNDLEYESGQKFIKDHADMFPGGGSGGPAGLNSNTTLDGLMKVIQQDADKIKKDPEEYNERIQQFKASKGYSDLKEIADGKIVPGLTPVEAKAILKAIDKGDLKNLPPEAQKIAENYLAANPQGAAPTTAPTETPDARAKEILEYGDKELSKDEKEKLKKAEGAIGKVDEAMVTPTIIENEAKRREIAEVLIKTVPAGKIDAVIDASASAKLKDDPKVGKERAELLKKTVKDMQPPAAQPAPAPAPTPVSRPAEGGGGPAQPPPETPQANH